MKFILPDVSINLANITPSMDSNLILSSPAAIMPMNHLPKPINQATFYVKFLLWNAHSLSKQFINFQSYIYAADLDIITIN